jgi:hypothetical protein
MLAAARPGGVSGHDPRHRDLEPRHGSVLGHYRFGKSVGPRPQDTGRVLSECAASCRFRQGPGVDVTG